jgi:hypothetical protein
MSKLFQYLKMAFKKQTMGGVTKLVKKVVRFKNLLLIFFSNIISIDIKITTDL